MKKTWKVGDRIRDHRQKTYTIVREHEGLLVAERGTYCQSYTQAEFEEAGFKCVTELRGRWQKWAGVAIATTVLVVACKATTVTPPVVRPQTVSELTQIQYSDADFVDIKTLAPNIQLDMRYATANNFLGRAVYPDARCLLRYSAAKRLVQVQQELEREGLGLKVFDCWRPLAVQKQMWAIKPDARYVADPQKGSRHNRGMAVDLTLIDEAGRELEMPTDFDDFSEKAHRNYSGASAQTKKNRQILEQAMVQQGFLPLDAEWWHFDALGWERFSIH